MNSVWKFAVPLFDSTFVLSFINLVFIQVEAALMEFVVFDMSNVNVLNIKLLSGLSIKLYFFPFKSTRLAFAEEKLVLVPVVKNKLFLLQL